MGAGLAANQIGKSMNIAVIKPSSFDCGDFEGSEYNEKFLVLINPVLKSEGTKRSWKEGCLSMPGVEGVVERYQKTIVSYKNEKGEPREFEADWPFSAGLQHECDHLNGITFDRRMKRMARSLMIGKLRKKNKLRKREEKRKAKDTKKCRL